MADGVVVVVPPGGQAHPALDATQVVEGGPTRAASVRAGLAAVPASAEVVVVHDAARPFASAALFRRVVAALGPGRAGAVPARPVAETLKVATGDTVVRTLARQGVVTVQTPQAFVADALRAAHATGEDATDDAALVEALGLAVGLVEGEPFNLKVTTPEDLALAEALIAGGLVAAPRVGR